MAQSPTTPAELLALPIGPSSGRARKKFEANGETIIGTKDDTGVAWTLCQYEDGGWFRQRV